MKKGVRKKNMNFVGEKMILLEKSLVITKTIKGTDKGGQRKATQTDRVLIVSNFIINFPFYPCQILLNC